MYQYIPPKNPQKTTGIILLLVAAAAVAVFFTTIFPNMPLRWLLQLFAVGILVAIIYITTRYVTKSYIYKISPSDREGGFDFTVTELTGGKHAVTVCRVGVESITEITRLTPENKAEAKKTSLADGRKRFIYICDIQPPHTLMLFAEECGESLAIMISADEEFASLLSRITGKEIG